MRNEKLHIGTLGLLSMLLLVMVPYLSAAIVNKASAAPGTEVRVVNPATGNANFTFYVEVTQNGTRFNMTVWVYNVTDLFSFQVYLALQNDTLLNITNAWVPSDNPAYVFYGKNTIPLAPAFYDRDGDGSIEGALVGECLLDITQTFDGTGLLGIFELQILSLPKVTPEIVELNINNTDTILLDSSQSDIIPDIIENGLCIFQEDNVEPTIGTPTQYPPTDIQPYQPVKVTVNVTDAETGVKNVTLFYTNNTEWYQVPMSFNETSELWEAIIPGFEVGTNVKYKIEAYDNANNYAVNDNEGTFYVYTVVPELSLVLIIIALMVSMTAVILVRKRKRKL